MRAWLGLANSGDQGGRFGVRVEMLKNGLSVAEDELRELFLRTAGTHVLEGLSGRAFRWRNGAIADLDDLISSGSGWVLTSAEGVNDHGQIVGLGTRAGQTRAHLLTPYNPTNTRR